MSFGRRRGVTLLELIVVLVIVAIGAGLALPSMSKGIENREAKQALQTMRYIAQGVRMYQVDKGVLPQNLQTDLEVGGYVNPNEYTRGFEYEIDTSASPIHAKAYKPNKTTPLRTITLEQSATNSSQDGLVTDTGGFLSSN